MKRSMRWVISGLAVLGFAHGALAADLDYLRGSEVFAPGPATYSNWSGFYVGGQFGFGNTQMDFFPATAPLIAFMLRSSGLENLGHISQWQILGAKDSRDTSFGGFIGYNSQWENVILGVEANYNRASIFGSDAGALRRIVTPGDGFIYDTTVVGTASMHITDYGTLRARAGYVMGCFLPYAMFGFAMGRVETTRSAEVFGTFTPTSGGAPASFAFSQAEAKPTYAIGYAAGAGVDIALMSNVFVRGEFEWVQFTNLPDMKANIATGRVAAGLKF
jgi:outer membrane immunogenic protein